MDNNTSTIGLTPLDESLNESVNTLTKKKDVAKKPEVQSEKALDASRIGNQLSAPVKNNTKPLIVITVVLGLYAVAATAGLTAIAVLYASQQGAVADYGESCASKPCIGSSGLVCLQQTCKCDSTHYYWGSTVKKCVDTGVSCNVTSSGVVYVSNGTTITNICNATAANNMPLSSYLEPCTSNSTCEHHYGLFCNTTISMCTCPYPFYWSDAIQRCVECPIGWVLLNVGNMNRCYYFSDATYYYWDAVHTCSSQASTLHVIDTIDEYNTVFTYKQNDTNEYFWIGLTYDYYGNYYWGNGLISSSGYLPTVGCANSFTYAYFAYSIGSSGTFVCNYHKAYMFKAICEKVL